MGLSNFTPTDIGGGSNSGSGGPSIPLSSLLNPTLTGGSDINDMLINYNETYKSATPALFRDEIVTQTMSIISSSRKPNALLVGPAGVGKTAIVEEIARRIANKEASVPPQLANTTIYELPIATLVAGAGVVGDLENRITEIIKFAQDANNDALLFIDEIHLIADSNNTTYAKIAQILKPAMARGYIRVIAATTMGEAKKLDDDPAFKRRFSSVIVDELTREQTRQILDIVLPGMLNHYQNKVTVAPDVLDEIVMTADRLMSTGHRPDTAITLLDRALSHSVISHHAAIQEALASGNTTSAQMLQQITHIPLTAKRLNTIAMLLVTGQSQPPHLDVTALQTELSRLRGQEEVLPRIVDALRRRELNIFPSTRPTSWLFAGASGVGKSETATIISSMVTGQKPIILNMAEYHDSASINRIIGSPTGYVGSDSAKERPFDTLASNPYRVIVLDEFEKADMSVQRLFLSALDTGEIQMANGPAVDLSRCIVIATTNAGRQKLSGSQMGFGDHKHSVSKQSLTKELQKSFDAELLGRFDDLIAFMPLGADDYAQILRDEYDRQVARIRAERPDLSFDPIDDDTIAQLVDETWLVDQGARPAIRAIRALIEDMLLAQAANS
jgi:ATPases with chaperone activity, ATP-binding subunit